MEITHLNILVTGVDSNGEKIEGFLTGIGAGKYTGVVTEWGVTHAVVKNTIKLIIPQPEEIEK